MPPTFYLCDNFAVSANWLSIKYTLFVQTQWFWTTGNIIWGTGLSRGSGNRKSLLYYIREVCTIIPRSRRWVQMLRRNVPPKCSGREEENNGCIFSWNVGTPLPDFTVPELRRRYYKFSTEWKLKFCIYSASWKLRNWYGEVHGIHWRKFLVQLKLT